MIQNLRNSSEQWRKGVNADQVRSSKPWDLSDPRHLSQLLQMSLGPDPSDPSTRPEDLKLWQSMKVKEKWVIPEASLQLMEWHLWTILHDTEKRLSLGLPTHSMLIVRAAVAASIIRFLRSVVFDNQKMWKHRFKETKINKEKMRIQAFLQKYMSVISLTSREVSDLKNILCGSFLHIGDAISAIYYHSEIASIQPPNVLLTNLFPPQTAEKLLASIQVIKHNAGEVGKSINKLEQNCIDLALMYMFKLYFFRQSSNGIDLDRYIVYQHSLINEDIIARMSAKPPAGYGKTPFIFYVGNRGWFVWDEGISYFANGSIEAMAIFLQLVKERNRVLDTTHSLPKFPPDDVDWKDDEKMLSSATTNNNPELDENGFRLDATAMWKEARLRATGLSNAADPSNRVVDESGAEGRADEETKAFDDIMLDPVRIAEVERRLAEPIDRLASAQRVAPKLALAKSKQQSTPAVVEAKTLLQGFRVAEPVQPREPTDADYLRQRETRNQRQRLESSQPVLFSALSTTNADEEHNQEPETRENDRYDSWAERAEEEDDNDEEQDA
jgi:hypothetical protein